MKRALLTGVTGFLGTNLVRQLSQTGDYELFGHSRNHDAAKKSFANTPLTLVPDCSAATLDRIGIDVVIHLAGIAHDLAGAYQPADYYRVNNENTRRVYDEFRKSNATLFIVLSSVKAAADRASTPLEEDCLPAPATDYGKSKWLAEQYLLEQPLPPGKKFYILRPCLVHGPGNKGNLNLLYRLVRRGVPYPLGDFDNRRSFLSVDNFIFAVRRIMESEMAGGVYHLADSDVLSTAELYRLMAETLGIQPRIWRVPHRWIALAAGLTGQRAPLQKLTGDFVVSSEKIRQAMGTDWPLSLRDGLIKTIRSFDE